MMAAIIYLLLEKSLLGDLDYYPATGNPYHFGALIPMVVVISFLFGIGIGMIEVFVLHKWFQRVGFGKKFVLKSVVYILFMVLVLLTLSTIGNMMLQGFSILDAGLWGNIWKFFTSMAFWTMEIYIAATIIVSLFFYEMSGNMGSQVMLNFLTGRYHKPIVEDRIFLFVDMKGSTAIAEKLGHVRYFEMLREYYAVLSKSILKNGGEIYQYVGDEIVITWRMKEVGHQKFLPCFFGMKRAVKKHGDDFMSTYGFVPTFKAGVHCGPVTTGEIGVIKQEIIFTGDVLNTAARIQGLCNELGVDILISDDLKQKTRLPQKYVFKSMGYHDLRGKQERVELFTVKMGNQHVSNVLN
jgi:adenylate cyclase